MTEHADVGWSAGDSVWRRRAEELTQQLDILRTAHVSLVRRHRELRAEAAAFRAATGPGYVVESERDGVVYRGASREAALTAARNASWATPFSSIVVLNGDAVVWSSRRGLTAARSPGQDRAS
jgi:hypothetical protein